MRVAVCRRGDVPPGTMRGFAVPGIGVPILVANLGGRFAASVGFCPHEDVALADGTLRGARVTCPGHGYEFDLDTGRCAHDRSLTLRRFPVTLVGDQVVVEVDLIASP